MSATPRPRRDVRWTTVGFICGGITGLTVLTSGVVAAAVDSVPLTRATAVERGLRDVLHTPPLLVARGQRVNVRYDVVCQSNGLGEPCELSGIIFVRRNGEFGYRRIPLVASEGSALTAALDGVAAGEGFSYYAIVEDGSGSTITVPAGGAAAPQRAWVVPAMTVAPLGTHAFGHTRRPDSRSMTASWGSGTNALGLITGRGQVAIGPSAFDVAPDGSITVLDQVNDRLAVYSHGRVRYEPIVFAGAEGDLAIGADGTTYVLDPGAEATIRTYTQAGASAGVARIAGSGADMLREGPGGAFVHVYPGDLWLPAGGAGRLLEPTAQVSAARAGRSVAGGTEVVVRATPTQALFALARGDRVMHAWRVTSAANIGEVQLAEPFGDGLLVVLRLWTDTEAEFVALVLSPAGLAESFAVDAAEWAESAALGRFRLAGGRLFQLRSTSAGAEVVTFDLRGAK